MIIDEARFQNYQRSIRQIVHTLQRFAQVLRVSGRKAGAMLY